MPTNTIWVRFKYFVFTFPQVFVHVQFHKFSGCNLVSIYIIYVFLLLNTAKANNIEKKVFVCKQIYVISFYNYGPRAIKLFTAIII